MKLLVPWCALLLAARSGLADTTLFTNAQPIVVTDPSSPSAATPYPSTIAVSGLESHAVVKVTVTLHGLSHTYPDDLDILLVGPHGEQVMLMSAGASGNPDSYLTLTFDDASPSVLPDTTGLSDGTFRPHNYGAPTDVLLSPAPPPPYATNLSVLYGTDPNGTWLLYVMDDSPEDLGAIDGGWSLDLETELRPASAALESGAYQTLPGATVEEHGDRVPNGSRVVPFSATLTFDLSADPPSLTALIPNAVLEGGDPFALTVRSLSWARLMDGTYQFTGDYLRDLFPSGTQYAFDWRFSRSTNGTVVWNGITDWEGGHIWYVTISNLTLVPRARLSISRVGTASVQISWATNFNDHVLEYATSLPAARWNTVTNAAATTGKGVSVTVDAGAAQRFYRLRKP